MPRVPQYEQQVNIRPLSTPQMSPDTAIASAVKGLGDTVQRVSGEFANIAEQEQKKANLEKAENAALFLDSQRQQAELAIKETQLEGAYGTPDDPEGITKKKLEEFDKASQDYFAKENLTDAQFKYALNLHAKERLGLEKTGLTHEAGEKTKAQNATFESFLVSKKAAIASTAADPTRQAEYQKNLDDGLAHIEQFATDHDWPQEVLDAKYNDFLSEAKSVKATQMINTNSIGAVQFIEDNKDDLGERYSTLKKSADLMETETLGYNLGQELFYANPKMTALEADKLIREKAGDKVSVIKKAREEFRTLKIEAEFAKKAEVEQIENNVHQFAVNVREKGRIPSRKDIPNKEWRAFELSDPKAADMLLKTWQHEREAKAAGANEPTARQWKLWYELVSNPETMANTNLFSLFSAGKLNKGQFSQLANAQSSMIKQEDKSAAQILKQSASLITSALKSADIVKGDARYDQAFADLAEWNNSQKATTGEYPTQTALLEKLKTGLMQDTKVGKSGQFLWSGDIPLAKVKTEDIVVPKKHINQIDAALKAQGKPITTLNRQKLYRSAVVQELINE